MKHHHNVAFITVLFHTPPAEVKRLTQEIKKMGIDAIYTIDNTESKKGYAAGVNEGLKKAIADGHDTFIIANNDISLSTLTKQQLLEPSIAFDIWGFAMRQNETAYYGGFLDKWRMSGGLSQHVPEKDFTPVDFVSGSFMVITKKVIDTIGLFDESYGMYYEEVDYCHRARLTGLRVGIDARHFYDHFDQSELSQEKKIWLAKNRLTFLLRYGTVKQKIYEILRSPKTVYEERALIRGRFKLHTFLFNFLTLNVSSLVNKILNFVLFIVLVRFVTPSEYGIYILVWAHINLLAPLLDLGTTSYGLFYGSDTSPKKLNALFSMRVYLSALVWIITLILAPIFRFSVTIQFYILLTSAAIFSNAASGSLLILTSILQRILIPSLLSFSFNCFLIATLIIILVISHSLNAVFIAIVIWYSIYTIMNYGVMKALGNFRYFLYEPAEWKSIISKSYVFVLLSLFAGLYFKTDIYILNFVKGQTDVGIYSAGYKFLDALMFVAASYNITAAPVFAVLKNSSREAVIKKMHKDILLLTAVGFFIAGSIYIFSPYLLPLILKGSFTGSIAVTRIVIFALPFILISSIFLNILHIYERSLLVLLLFIFQFVINVVLNVLFIPSFSYIASANITVACEVLNLVILYIITMKVIKAY
jgi:O-antigen/teichoic acid export membrane protein